MSLRSGGLDWTPKERDATWELAQFVLHAIGIKEVVTHLTTFAELLPGVAAGRWTLNVPLFVTPERAALVSFSRPVWALQDGFIVRAGNPKSLHSYSAVAAVGDARSGVVAGQVQHEVAARAGVPSTRIDLFPTQEAVMQALVAGDIDAYASTALGNRMFLRALNNAALLAVEFDEQCVVLSNSRSGRGVLVRSPESCASQALRCIPCALPRELAASRLNGAPRPVSARD